MTNAVQVTVPATAANLGPGFDCLGLAVNLCNEVILQTAGGFRSSGEPNVCVTVNGLGEKSLTTGRGNLVVRAAERVFAQAGRIPDRLTVRLPSGTVRIGAVFYRGVDADYATQRDVSRTKRDIKTFEVRLRLDNSDRRLWPGLTAYVVLPPDKVR